MARKPTQPSGYSLPESLPARHSPLFSTSLEPIETTPDVDDELANLALAAEYRADAAAAKQPALSVFYRPTAEEARQRHGLDQEYRLQIIAAMEIANISGTRLERFKCCGSSAWVEWSAEAQRHRVHLYTCKDRMCRACGRTRSGRIQAHLKKLTTGREVRMITLPLKHRPGRYTEIRSRLQQCWRNLRESPTWNKYVEASCCIIEDKRSKCGKMWHPHLHILYIGKYFPHRQLQSAWMIATGDSFICDIRPLPSDQAISYVTKYLSKGVDDHTLSDPRWMAEYMEDVAGRRNISFTGSWRTVRIGDEDAQVKDWVRIDLLDNVITAARMNLPWAIAVMTSLRSNSAAKSSPLPQEVARPH